MNCNKCGKFMKLVADWDEYPLGPYVNTEWKCMCGNTRIYSDDFRLKILKARKNGMKSEPYVPLVQSSAPTVKKVVEE